MQYPLIELAPGADSPFGQRQRGAGRLATTWPLHGSAISVCVAAAHDFDDGLKHDGKVESETPVVDVPEIMLDAPLDIPRRRCWTPTAVHLSPACQTWLDAVSKCIISNNLVKLRV